MVETIGLMETMRDGGDHWVDYGVHEGLYGPWWMIDGDHWDGGGHWDGGDHWDDGEHWVDGDCGGWWRPLG